MAEKQNITYFPERHGGPIVQIGAGQRQNKGGGQSLLRKIVSGILALSVILCFGLTERASSQEGLSFLQLIERDIQSLADKLRSSVVTIRAISRTQVESDEHPDARRRAVVSTFVGSGLVLDTSGHILTSALVVEGRDRFLVELPDLRVYEATLVGKNPASDVAILHTRARGLTPPDWGDSDSLRTGSVIVVLGNSYGCPHSVSWGTVNGLRPDGTTIQMNVAVSAGNSGGAVINSCGQVVGLVKAKISESSHVPAMRVRQVVNPAETWYLPEFKIELPTSGIALAVPINTALDIAGRIVNGQGEEYPYLGVYVSDLHSWLARYYHTDQGVVVAGVVDNTPAAKYGLEQGDLIRHFNKAQVQTVRHFRELVANTSPGDRVLLDILRNGAVALKVNLVMGRAGTPNIINDKLPRGLADKPNMVRRDNGVRLLRPDDSMSIERLNEIRRRILQSADSLGSMPVDMKIDQ